MDPFVQFWQLCLFTMRLCWWTVKTCLLALFWGWKAISWPFRPKVTTNYGSARFATPSEIRKSGLLHGKGPIIGKVGRKFLRCNDPQEHILIFAPTRTGKGVGIVIPTILDYAGSLVVLDPKGENHAITHRHRATLGTVLHINLIDISQSVHINPMDMIRDASAVEDASNLAELLLYPAGKHDAHWREGAKKWLVGMLLFIHDTYRDRHSLRTLQRVHTLYNELVSRNQQTLDDMLACHTYDKVSTTANDIMHRKQGDGEAAGFFANIGHALDIFSKDSPVGQITEESSFTLDDLHSSITTLYISIPFKSIKTYAPFTRVMVGMVLENITEQEKLQNKPDHPTLLLLDEAASLGYMQSLEEGMAYLAAYARVMLIFQDYSQLNKTYPNATTFLANCKYQVAFGINDEDTARYVARKLGKQTLERESTSRQKRGMLSLAPASQSHNADEMGRDLLDTAEIQRMSQNMLFAFCRKESEYPIAASTLRYFKEYYFQGRYDSMTDQTMTLASTTPHTLPHHPVDDWSDEELQRMASSAVQRYEAEHGLSAAVSDLAPDFSPAGEHGQDYEDDNAADNQDIDDLTKHSISQSRAS